MNRLLINLPNRSNKFYIKDLFNRYKELVDGVVKIFINTDTEVNYKKILDELDAQGISVFFEE